MRSILSAIVILCLGAAARADDAFLLKDARRVVFLGDSNTHSGKYVTYLDAYLSTRFPDKRIELINLGLPSETVTGLSEADHPFPRPNIHDRIDRALELTKPDVVVIAYGMNDGIYAPFDAERFKKYQDGMTKLIEKVEKAGAKVVLMTPPPFDPKPLKDKVQAKDAAKFSWLRPYARYDEEVLAKYTEWLVSLRQKKYTVIDAHAALHRHLAAMRKEHPDYSVSKDGIHPNADGHLVVVLELLRELKAPTAVKDIAIDTNKDPASESDVKIIRAKGSFASFSFLLPRPMPADPAWSQGARELEKFDEAVNRHALKIEGPRGFLAIRIGNPKDGAPKGIGRRVPIQADEIGKGIDLANLLQVLPDKTAPEIFKLIDERNRVLAPAWLTQVGHKRPDTPKGLPLDDAKKQAATLDEKIRALCRPTEHNLGIGPFGK